MVDDTTPQHTDDDDTDDLDAVADRLEAALDRIVRRLDTPRSDTPRTAPPIQAAAELAARLDALIGRLREALSRAPGSSSGEGASGGHEMDRHTPDGDSAG